MTPNGFSLYHLMSRGNEGGNIFFEKDTRDLLLYYIWRTGRMTNAQIGLEFGLSYSAVSHSVKSIKAKLKNDQKLKALFYKLNSQFKL